MWILHISSFLMLGSRYRPVCGATVRFLQNCGPRVLSQSNNDNITCNSELSCLEEILTLVLLAIHHVTWYTENKEEGLGRRICGWSIWGPKSGSLAPTEKQGVDQAGFEFTNSASLCPLSTKIAGVFHHTWFITPTLWGWGYGDPGDFPSQSV